MTAVPLLNHHPGRHCAPKPPSIFRRLRLRWKPSAPEMPAASGRLPFSGAGTALLTGRFACCVHCDTEPCDPPDNHLAPCSSGCNKPVLGDRMLSEVRAEYSQPRYTPTEPIFIPSQVRETGPMQALRPVNGRSLGDQPRRTPVPYAARAHHDGPAPDVLKRVAKGLRKLDEPGFGVDRCEADVLLAERGLSFDCGNGLHAPVCDGRHCSCSCHRSAA